MRLAEEIVPDPNQIDAFPPDQSLAMDTASRMARAKSMGFDVNKIWYHGSPRFSAIKQFNPAMMGRNTRHPGAGAGFYFTDNPREAVEYGLRKPLQTRRDEFDIEAYRGRIMGGFLLRMQRAFVLKQNIDDFTEYFGGLHGDPDRAAQGVQAWIADLKADGYDGIIAKQDAYGERGHHAIVFSSHQVRSDAAAFDPAKRDSDRLTA